MEEWNSGCDRLRLWQACVKLVSPESKDMNDLVKLSGMTSWSFDALMGHRKEVKLI